MLAKQLVKQAEINAEVAGDLLEAAQKGEKVDQKLVKACEKIAEAVKKAAEALGKGKIDKAKELMERIAELESSLPTAANARAEMQRADGAGKHSLPTAANQYGTGKTYRFGTCSKDWKNIVDDQDKILERCKENEKCELGLGGAYCKPCPRKASPSSPTDCP